MAEPSKEELLTAPAGSIDTEALTFSGLRGDRTRHLSRMSLEAGLAALAPAPRDQGRVDLLVARGPDGERSLPHTVELTVAGGLSGDRWASQTQYGPEYQLATVRTDFARLIANDQPLELHGDNLFLDLDLSSDNVPPGTLISVGGARLQLTPQPHNGCKKWVQRFGLDAMQINLAPAYRHLRLRGVYFRVVEPGQVRVGDDVRVLSRG